MKKVRDIHIKHAEKDDRTIGDKASDRVASFGGSWAFVLTFASVLVAWIIWNVLALTGAMHFDKYPFILMNLFLSFIAAFQAPIIMMSQNRQAEKDRKNQQRDLEVDEHSEQLLVGLHESVEDLHRKVDFVIAHE